MSTMPTLADAVSCLSDYDPQALRVSDAQRVIERFVKPVEAIERVAIRAALDRILALDVISPIDVPGRDNSAMDGFAVRGADLASDAESRFVVVGTAVAGKPLERGIGQGEAVRIMTGAVMPDGADTVVIQEVVRLGLLASLGVAEVPVRRRLRVAFFSTGDELRSIGESLAPGQVYDSNRYTLHGMLRRLGVELIDMGVVGDSPEALEEAMRIAGESADAIISSGGVSVGEADFTRQVMAKLGDVAFWKIAMRPGRPMAFGRVGEACYFGLPGNPVAVMITFYFFARDALLRMMGATPQPQPYLRARALDAMRKKPGRTEYQRAVVTVGNDGLMEVRVTGGQGSGVLRSMSEANCIVVLHHDQGSVRPGDPVECLAFHGLI